MKRFVLSIVGAIGSVLFLGSSVFAQGIMSNTGVLSNGHTAREETEGKAVWEKLQAKQTTCSELSDDNFGTLGEYFMGTMLGNSHESMNNAMVQMIGAKGEEQMHVAMGKRLSGCDKSAPIPSQGIGFISAMDSMMGGWSNDYWPMHSNSMMRGSYGFGNSMMGGYGGGWIASIVMIFWWILIIAAAIALIRWLFGKGVSGWRESGKSALDILKERYASGEIDKKEFEERKNDLNN